MRDVPNLTPQGRIAYALKMAFESFTSLRL